MEPASDLSNDDLVVATSEDDLVVEATIDRPAEQNALNEDVLLGLGEALDYADASEARVFVIRGAGGTFCAGGDLKSMTEVFGEGSAAYREEFTALSAVLRTMVETSVLTVAAVEGYCLAGGLGLAAACEFVVAHEDATFGTPEVGIGLVPAQAMAPITRAMDEKAALKLLFTGEFVDAGQAAEFGLVTDVYADDEFEAALQGLVDDLANNSPLLVELGKRAFYTQRNLGYDDALDYLQEVITVVAMSDATEEGIQAYLNDETPDWERR